MKGIKKFAPGADEASARRPFTTAELSLIFQKAPDAFWRYMIVGGFFTGLRLGDLICLKFGAIDFKERTIRVLPRKTARHGRAVTIPIGKRLRETLLDLYENAVQRAPADFLWPEQAERYLKRGPGEFSSAFYELVLTPCGLVAERETKHATKKGRRANRQRSPVSFHSLRHTFITLVKVTGGNQAVAKALAGHSSDVVSDLYTHLPLESLRAAVSKLPEVWQ